MTLQVDGDQPAEIRARNIIVATGSEARLLPGLSLDGQTVLTNKEILDLESVPKSLLVIGAGALGVEFASMFAHFGSDVTVVEMQPQHSSSGRPRNIGRDRQDPQKEANQVFNQRPHR